MFYERQPVNQQNDYKNMLATVGSLSNLFSESDCPYLSYRAHENIFCKYFEADNLARTDCSADAKKGAIGVGLKTWTGQDDQKVAEFGRLKHQYAGLTGIDLVRRIAEYRNERIRVTKNMHGIDEMIYHVVRRIPGAMQILECAFDPIDIPHIQLITDRGNDNNTYFTDQRHTYHFSTSKNTLYMIFDDLALLDTIEVEIIADPYAYLTRALLAETTATPTATPEPVTTPTPLEETEATEEATPEVIPAGEPVAEPQQIDIFAQIAEDGQIAMFGPAARPERENQLCLPLYSVKADGTKFVAERSGLNQWNARGRARDINELYIPYQSKDRNRNLQFFPPRDTSFTLHLPDGTEMSAKTCQEADPNNPLIGKAIMSNPNKALGKWLLRDVLEIPEGEAITYEMLERFGIDCVIFTKNADLDYSIDFGTLGTYEEFYGDEENTEEE